MEHAQRLVHADASCLVQVERDVVGGHAGAVAAEETGILRRVRVAGVERVRQVEDVLIEEWHLDIRVGVVEVDGCLQRPAGNRYADAGGKVGSEVVLEVIEQYPKLASRGRESESCRVQIDDGRAGVAERLEGR